MIIYVHMDLSYSELWKLCSIDFTAKMAYINTIYMCANIIVTKNMFKIANWCLFLCTLWNDSIYDIQWYSCKRAIMARRNSSTQREDLSAMVRNWRRMARPAMLRDKYSFHNMFHFSHTPSIIFQTIVCCVYTMFIVYTYAW